MTAWKVHRRRPWIEEADTEMTQPQLKMFQNGTQPLEAERIEKNPSPEPIRSHGPMSIFFLDSSLQRYEGMNSCLRSLGIALFFINTIYTEGQQFILRVPRPPRQLEE